MRSSAIPAALLAVLTAAANAQVFYNTTTRMLECPPGRNAFCDDYLPLSSNVIIRCYGRRAVPANCNDNLAGVYPIGIKDSAKCFDSLNGVVACSYNGFVYPDGGNPYQLPAAFAQYLQGTNASSTNTSTTPTMSMNLPSGPGFVMPTPKPTSVPLAPGSGGFYNVTTVTGSGLASLTGHFPIPRPTAPIISGASRSVISIALSLLLGALICVVVCYM
ncbi:MAG: hypothetical protein Q9169_006336 [Polycauliona sp. 2 TL-2023]